MSTRTVQAIIIAALILPAVVIVGCRPQTGTPPTPPPQEGQTGEEAARSWIDFVADAMRNCEANCCVDYQMLHEYDDGSFAVMAVGYRDSEYLIDLFRYDPEQGEWVSAPKHETEFGDQIDFARTVEDWGVPRDTLEEWYNETQDVLQNKYQSR